jgi:beta-lactamase superfamily II metal-dependent hydrolase
VSELTIRIFDVEHGACAIIEAPNRGRLAMIDSGHNATTGWRPSLCIRYNLQRTQLDYLLVTNADQDHLSDLEGLWTHGVSVLTLYRNLSPDPAALRVIKEEQGELTDDIERFLNLHSSYTAPVTIPFDQGMGGAVLRTYCNRYPDFADTNNLSMVAFIQFGTFKILFPGDLEAAGWRHLLHRQDFVDELRTTTVLVASHHGRENGWCDEAFEILSPRAVVISDKPIQHATQEMVPAYQGIVAGGGIRVGETLLTSQLRRVLTTRRDGDITFNVWSSGDFSVRTSK